MTSKAALDALIKRQVQGTLLDYNEAANLQNVIIDNGLKISKKIASTSGIGFVLSDSMASFHIQIRSYVHNNYNLIQALVKNYTKDVNVSYVLQCKLCIATIVLYNLMLCISYCYCYMYYCLLDILFFGCITSNVVHS